jgi:outer membrane autotransporter protein
VPAGENGGAPTGTVIWTGIAAPVAGWGSGGGQQSQLRGTWIPSGSYRNGQLLGAQALVYTPSAGKGSAGRVAVYLDAAIPQAYSDLEDVYIALDFLNYGDKGPLQAALTGISPLVLESLTDVATRGAWRMNKAIRDRALGDGTRKTAVWADGARESLSREDSGEHAGYSAKTDAVYAGAELRQSPEASAGICAGSSRSRVDWLSGNGSASRDSRRLGFYWERRGRALRLLGSLGAGWAQARVDRGISFSGADRIAHSDQYDHDLSGQLQAEYTLNVSGWDVRPAAGLEYTYLVIGDFTESGAGRLNLSVKKRMPLTFRGSLWLGLSKALPAGAGWTMRPGLRFGWANEAPLDDRAITAVMSGRPDGFSVDGRKGPVDSFWLGFGMSVSKGAFLAYVRCEGELGRGFNANAAKAGVTLRF